MPHDATSVSAPVTTTPTSTVRDLMRAVAQPVIVISGTGPDDPEPRAMTISSLTSVALDPPLVLFCPSRHSRTWAALAPTGRFVVNVLSEHQHDVAARFGHRRDRSPMRTAAVRWTHLGGVPALVGSVAAASCDIVDVHPGGDHEIVVASVREVVRSAARRPLSYWRGSYATLAEAPPC